MAAVKTKPRKYTAPFAGVAGPPPGKGLLAAATRPAPVKGSVLLSSAPAAAPAAVPALPPIQPFLRPEDLQALNDFQFSSANSLADIDKGLTDLTTATNFNRQATDKAAKQSSSDATDNAIARGLFQSSIKDATLYDIEGQRARQQQLYTDQLNNATLDGQRRKGIIQQAQDALQNRLNDQAVENARLLSEQQTPPPPAPPPPAPAAVAPAAPTAKPYKSQAGTSSKGVAGVWHIYPDGRKVFVAGGQA